MSSIIGGTIVSSIILIAFSVWGLLMFYAQRSALDTAARRSFGIASGMYLFGWLALAFVLGGAGYSKRLPRERFQHWGLASHC